MSEVCRLFALMADREYESAAFSLVHAPHSLLRQSNGSPIDFEGEAHPHGWGIGYYDDDVPVLAKAPEPASESKTYGRAAEHARSYLFIAHVRLRTIGDV